jgi:hypothetical protein
MNYARPRRAHEKEEEFHVKKLFAAFAVLAILSAPAFAEDKPKAEAPKASACCMPECKMDKGKCTTHEAKKCEKDCAKPCCKKAEEPKKPA